MSLERELQLELETLERNGLLRRLTQIDERRGPRVRVEGCELLLLCGNDYLGLAGDPRLAQAAAHAAREHGTGSGSSRLISGDCELLRRLERAAAELVELPEALAFGSGYQANVGLLGALAGPEDALLSDELNHASIIDGARLSAARKLIYPHLDLDALERGLIEARTARRRIVVSETLFSMDGDSPDLSRLAELCQRHDAWLVLDEAHALGVLGPHGAGLAAEHGVSGRVAALVGTLGKAFGSSGAFVAGSRVLREFLINRCRSLIFSTAPSPTTAAAATMGIEIALGMDAQRAALLRSADELRHRLREYGFDAPSGQSPIVPLLLGDPAAALRGQRLLWDQGVWVQAIRPPTVPQGTSRLRISLRADLCPADLELAARAFAQLAAQSVERVGG
ncbi:MAG: 8-amino-7-oxononanoate synthase [Candidatus Alcyoniella australis]|nr:8-amino-7-oxononanoate synthase [Candidatus Alcyoniella australis]